MAKKHKVVLPSLTESTKGKVVGFPLVTKLDKRNVELLEYHGYQVQKDVLVRSYRVLPPNLFSPFLLFMYMLLQDILKGSFFNKNRYPLYLMLLQAVYHRAPTEKQSKAIQDYLEEGGHKDVQLGSTTFSFKPVDEEVQQEEEIQPTPKQKKVILIASDYAGVGKSYFSQTLVDQIGEDRAVKMAFMDELRGQLAHLFSVSDIDPSAFFPQNYNKTKNVSHTYSDKYPPFVLRELICDYSDLLQIYFGETYWASLTEDFINNTDEEVYVIDDLRRPIELEYMKKHFGEENVITVYLTRQGAVKPTLSATALGYEGKLDPNEFDIQFEFTSDWSNTNDLIKSITERL
jgi:hypothetical protein